MNAEKGITFVAVENEDQSHAAIAEGQIMANGQAAGGQVVELRHSAVGPRATSFSSSAVQGLPVDMAKNNKHENAYVGQLLIPSSQQFAKSGHRPFSSKERGDDT